MAVAVLSNGDSDMRLVSWLGVEVFATARGLAPVRRRQATTGWIEGLSAQKNVPRIPAFKTFAAFLFDNHRENADMSL